jgi:hypothetical protein
VPGRLASWRQLGSRESSFDRFFERLKFDLDSVPDDFVIGAVIGMSENVTHASEADPIRTRTERLGIGAKAISGFAEDGEFALDSCFCL